MRSSFAQRTPGEPPTAPRGMLGFLARSQASQHAEYARTSFGFSSESEDDGDPERFRYPGMPREPRPIKLSDPYPGGKLAGSRAATEQQGVEPLVHDGSTTVLFIKAGSEHRALLYLMQKVNRLFALDDMLPEVSPEIAGYHYLVLAPPKDGPVDGDASTSFRNSTLFLLSGMVVRRVKVVAKDPLTMGLLDSTVMQRRMPVRKLAAKLAGDAPNGPYPASPGKGGRAGALEADGSSSSISAPSQTIVRKAGFTARMGPEAAGASEADMGRQTKRWASAKRSRRNAPPELIPVAIYSHPLYLDTAAQIIRNFNRTGLIVTPYLYSTIVAAAAVSTIQGWWRSHLIRGLSNFGALLRMSRAARTIQRAWRAFILRSRLEMLAGIRRLAASVGGLLLGANLALTVGHCMLLRDRAGRPRPALFPEQRLRFGFDRAGGLMLVEPERMMPKPARDGNWHPGLPPPPVPRSLPEWCGVPLPLCGERAAVSVHGCREVLGLGAVLQLLTRDTVWRDNSGNELSRATLPDTSPPDPGATAAALAGGGSPADVVLAVITFSSVHEAAVRAALLAAYTWDPLRRSGVTLVPLHQTAAARGVQTQQAVVQAISVVAAGAGHLVTTAAPPTSDGAAAAPPMYTSTAALVWRHAPPGSRERQRAGGGGGGGGTPPREALSLRSPTRGGGGSGLGSPLHTGGVASGGSSFSHAQSHHSLSRSHSHGAVHLQGQGSGQSRAHSRGTSPGRGGSPSRAVSPQRQRGGGGGSGMTAPGTPSSPSRGQRSPAAHQGAAAAGPPPPSGGGISTSPLPSPTRRRGWVPPLPPVHFTMRPGTVPSLSGVSKFQDLDPATPGLGRPSVSNPLMAALTLPAPLPSPLPAGVGQPPSRPHTTPLTRLEGEVSAVASFGGTEPSLLALAGAHGHRSSGGLYGTQPGAPQPLQNVPLSSLARALSPPSTHRVMGMPRSSGSAPHHVQYDTNSLGNAGASERTQTPESAAGASTAGVASPYRGYDMSGTAAGPAGAATAVTAVAAAGGDGEDGGGGGGITGGRGTPASTVWESERAGTPAGQSDADLGTTTAAEEGQSEGRQVHTPDGMPAPSPQSPASPTSPVQQQVYPPPQPPWGDPLAGFAPAEAEAVGFGAAPQQEEAAGAGEVGPGGEGPEGPVPCEEPEDPFAHMTVLQRHQARGLFSDMLLLPVPHTRPGAEVQTAEEAAADAGLLPEKYDTAYGMGGAQPSLVSLGGLDTGVGVLVDDAAAAEPSLENPELVVARMNVEFVHPASLVAELAENLGDQGRDDRHYADNTARIGKLIGAEERFARHRELMSTLMLTQVIGRQTAVGHVPAPNYTPLSVRAMSQIVTEMRRVYQGEAAELVANMREQHKEAIAAVKAEMAASARLIASTSCMQAAIVDSELARAEEERGRVVRSRATRAHLRALRRERAAQDRAFASAFGRQVAGASKQIVRSEIRARDAVMAEAAASQVAFRRQLDQLTQEHISLAAAELAATNRVRASVVRSEGWTTQVAGHYHLLDQWQADLVALRRDDNYARMRRVGPAGGIWGAARPRELLRAPLPVTNVVSAAAATAAAAAASADDGSEAGSGGAGAVRPLAHTSITLYTPPDSGGTIGVASESDGLFGGLPSGAVNRVSFSTFWPPFEGDHGSLATSSTPASTLPISRQTPNRRSLLPVPHPLPEGYVPTTPPPLIENSSEAGASQAAESSEATIDGLGGLGGLEVLMPPVLKPGAKAAALAALAAANGLRQRGSPPRALVEGPEGRLVDFLPEAYPIQPFGGRNAAPTRPVGMVVSRY